MVLRPNLGGDSIFLRHNPLGRDLLPCVHKMLFLKQGLSKTKKEISLLNFFLKEMLFSKKCLFLKSFQNKTFSLFLLKIRKRWEKKKCSFKGIFLPYWKMLSEKMFCSLLSKEPKKMCSNKVCFQKGYFYHVGIPFKRNSIFSKNVPFQIFLSKKIKIKMELTL